MGNVTTDSAPGQSKFTTERQETILAALREGKTKREAAGLAGIYIETLETWRLRHPWFAEAVRDAIAGSPRRITRTTFDALVAAMRSGATAEDALKSVGVTNVGMLRWVKVHGLGPEYQDALNASRSMRRRPKPDQRKPRKLLPVEKVDRDMTDDAIAQVAALIRSAPQGKAAVEDAVLRVLGRLPTALWDWRKAFPARAQPIADAVAWVRAGTARTRTEEMLAPLSRRAMLDAIERGCGWNGIAKSVGSHTEAFKRWCAPPFHSAEHEAFVGELMAAWEREKAERTAAARGHVTSKRARRDKDARLKQTYGITLLQAEAMQARQRGGCAICGTKLRPIGEVHDPKSDGNVKPVVDHCHDTGKVRGILCGPCNTGIGQLGDSAARLESAAAYLRQTQPKGEPRRQAIMASGGGAESQQPGGTLQKTQETQCELWALEKAHK